MVGLGILQGAHHLVPMDHLGGRSIGKYNMHPQSQGAVCLLSLNGIQWQQGGADLVCELLVLYESACQMTLGVGGLIRLGRLLILVSVFRLCPFNYFVHFPNAYFALA